MVPKLVRDRIPDIIRTHGERPKICRLDDRAYGEALKAKLVEEVDEYVRATDDAFCVEELVDVLEVVRALAAFHGVDAELLEMKRAEKCRDRGAFSERIFLIDVE